MSLRKIPIFSRLDDQGLAALERIATTKTYSKNTIVLSEGDTTDSLYVVLKGKAYAVSSNEDGKQIILNVFRPNDYFGEMSFIDGKSRCANIITRKTTQLMIVPGRGFRQIIANSQETMFLMMKDLLQKVRRATRQIEQLAFNDVYSRVARFLTEYSNSEGIIGERITHQEIAYMVGASREMVSRIMKELSDGGQIEKYQGRIRITSRLPYKY
jgi:CRP/FNR family cyclic AMP-dependent transcriptional regulator